MSGVLGTGGARIARLLRPPVGHRHGPRRACIGDPGLHRVPARDRCDGRGGDGVRGDDSMHAALRMAWRGAGRGCGGPYAQWVQTYADPSFEALASRLERLLDEHADDRPAVRAAYRRAMHLELAFFDAALLPSG